MRREARSRRDPPKKATTPAAPAAARLDAAACSTFSRLERARRRGLGTALTARLIHDARERGCSTASRESPAMAERVYATVGFRDLGAILE
jgi:GNAT superfamily N-acetyltransferase